MNRRIECDITRRLAEAGGPTATVWGWLSPYRRDVSYLVRTLARERETLAKCVDALAALQSKEGPNE